MAHYRVCPPANQIVIAFQDCARSFIDRLNANIHEMTTLEHTLDLLPKLISKELRLPDNEDAMRTVSR